MNRTYKTLRTDMELFAAAMTQLRVYIVSVDETCRTTFENFGGAVERIAPDSVTIAGKVYERDQYEFRAAAHGLD